MKIISQAGIVNPLLNLTEIMENFFLYIVQK